MSESSIRATKSAAALLVEARPEPTLALLPLEERQQVAGDERAAGGAARWSCSGSSRSGSVTRIFWSTTCSPTARCANTSPSSTRLAKSGAPDDGLGERAEEPAHLPRHDLAQQLVLAAGEDPVDGRRATRRTPSRRPRPSSCRARSGRSTRTRPRASARAAPGPALRPTPPIGSGVEQRVEPDGEVAAGRRPCAPRAAPRA